MVAGFNAYKTEPNRDIHVSAFYWCRACTQGFSLRNNFLEYIIKTGPQRK